MRWPPSSHLHTMPNSAWPVARPRSSAWEEGVVYPLLLLAALYHVVQCIPAWWLPAPLRQAGWGFPSDVFLLLHMPTSVPTRVLRDALPAQLSWLAPSAVLEALLARLSSVEGRVRIRLLTCTESLPGAGRRTDRRVHALPRHAGLPGLPPLSCVAHVCRAGARALDRHDHAPWHAAAPRRERRAARRRRARW